MTWLGIVPSRWMILPGRACFEEKYTSNIGLIETDVLSLSYGKIVKRQVELNRGLLPASFETYQIVEPGDIICRPTDLQNDWVSLRFGLSELKGIITSAYMRLVPQGEMTRQYGYLLLHAYDLKKVFYGLGSGLRQNLSWADFKYLPCLVPPISEQRAIARYLDYVDGRIRRYIRAKERLIELLEEQKRAVINQAVTRGLDPDVPLKPSGVEWLGDIPARWEVRRLKATVSDVQTGVWGDDPDGSDNDVYCIRVADFDRFHNRISTAKLTLRSVKPVDVAKCRLRTGDLLIEKSGGGDRTSVGAVMIFDHDINAVCSNFIARIRTDAGYEPFYMNFVHQALYNSGINVFSIKQTTGIQNLDLNAYFNTKFGFPPNAEQRKITDRLGEVATQIGSAVERANAQIELMKEYRTRLIADVVTGKLDVRDAAANLPDGVDEYESLDRSYDPNRLELAEVR